jgi:dipeptidase E
MSNDQKTKKTHKLLLTSRGTYITDGRYEIFDKPRNRVKWGHITTAGKSVPDDSYLQNHRQRMQELGWDFEEIDIAGKNEDELRKILHDKEAVFVEGGNAFYLLKCIRASGFEKVMHELLDRGVVYVGSSAGSYVACPTIEMATWKDPTKYDRYGVTDFTAMNLVPFLIFAHYTPDMESVVKPKTVAVKYPVKPLTDQQALFIYGDKVELLEDKSIKSKWQLPV